jgi:solute carrier family 25 oxoglutarate transporter 11
MQDSGNPGEQVTFEYPLHFFSRSQKINKIVDVEFWRRIVPTVAASALTCWMSVPFEVARAAYYADRTYPKELQKGYSSIANALLRIPKEEGVNYLFKSAVPIMARNYVAFSFLTYLYDFSYDKLRVLEIAGEHPSGLLKFSAAGFATFWACFASMPWDVTVRRLVEFTPKIDGKNIFDGNYRKAFSYLWYYKIMAQYYHGFSTFFWRQAPGMFAVS